MAQRVQPCSTASHITATSSRPATTPGASKAAMMIKQPALAPSPQPRPAPTVRALPAELAAQRGPFWMPIRGPNPTPIDTYNPCALCDDPHGPVFRQPQRDRAVFSPGADDRHEACCAIGP